MKIEPIKSSPQLTDEIVASHTRADRRAQLNLLYDSPKLGFRVEHDRQWFITSQQREAVTLRRVDRGDMVAQCTLSALPVHCWDRAVYWHGWAGIAISV